MGLDRDFLAMLTAPIDLKRNTGTDLWGNETYAVAEAHKGYIAESTSSYGGGEKGGEQDKKAVTTTQVMTDALGIEVGDIIAFGGLDRSVTSVETVKDETGADLYQMSTVEDQKKG